MDRIGERVAVVGWRSVGICTATAWVLLSLVALKPARVNADDSKWPAYRDEIKEISLLAIKISETAKKAERKINPRKPEKFDLQTDEWLAMINAARERIEKRTLPSDMPTVPPIALDAQIPVLHGEIMRGEMTASRYIGHVESILVEEHIMEGNTVSVRAAETLREVLLKNLTHWLLLTNNRKDHINLEVDCRQAIERLHGVVSDKIKQLKALRGQRGKTLLDDIARLLHALNVQETRVNSAIASNKEKYNRLKSLLEDIESAEQELEWARSEKASAETELKNRQMLLEEAEKARKEPSRAESEASAALRRAENTVNTLQATINGGLYQCPNYNDEAKCTHFTERAEHNKRYYSAIQEIGNAKQKLAEAKSRYDASRRNLDAADKKINDAKYFRDSAKTKLEAAIDRVNQKGQILSDLRKVTDPLIAEIRNIIFSSGDHDLLPLIAASRERLRRMEQRAVELAK